MFFHVRFMLPVFMFSHVFSCSWFVNCIYEPEYIYIYIYIYINILAQWAPWGPWGPRGPLAQYINVHIYIYIFLCFFLYLYFLLQQNSDVLLNLFSEGVSRNRLLSVSQFRTHTYHQTARNFETNPMGTVPGSETQVSRK